MIFDDLLSFVVAVPDYRLLTTGYCFSEFFQLASLFFWFESFSSGGGGWFCFSAFFWWFCCLSDHCRQAFDGFVTVLALLTVSVGVDNEYAATAYPLTRQIDKPPLDGIAQRWWVWNIKAKLGGCRYLVDVLPARPGRPDEIHPNLILVNRNILSNAKQCSMLKDK